MRWMLKLTIFILMFFAVERACKKQTGGFSILRITSHLQPSPIWDIPPLTAEEHLHLEKILNQKFFYLNKGVQSFVFGSEDGNYVIKFFRHDRYKRGIPFRKNKRRDFTLKKDFESYKIAYEHFKEYSGLIFLHLNKTDGLMKTMTIVDKLGIQHELPLDQYEFLIQKRATLLYTSLNEMISNNETEKCKQTLSKLVQLLALRNQKGFFDKDSDLNTNFGVIGTNPIQIDVGRFRQRSSCLFDRSEIIRITDNLHQWLMVRSPELDTHLKKEIEKL